MFIPQARKKTNWWIYSRLKISVFLLYSREMFSEVVENLIFTGVRIFVFEVSAWKACLCVCVLSVF